MSTIRHLLNQLEIKYGLNTSKNANKYIKTKINLVKNELDTNFIKKCLNNDTLPSFSKIKLATTNNKQFISQIRSQITDQELNNKIRNKRALKKKEKDLINKLFDLTPEENENLNRLITNKINNISNTKNKIHNKKLEKLGITTEVQVDNKNINRNRNKINEVESIKDKETIFNLSSRILNETETNLLKKGLKYGIKAKKVDSYEILARFEQLAQSLNKLEAKPSNNPELAQFDNKAACMKQLQSMATEFIELSKTARDNLTDAEHKALEELSKDQSIIITKADKGNAVVIQNKTDYLTKVNILLSADDKFKEIHCDVTTETIKRERRLQNYLSSIGYVNEKRTKGTNELTDEVLAEITPCGSRAGIMYGLPKIQHISLYT